MEGGAVTFPKGKYAKVTQLLHTFTQEPVFKCLRGKRSE